MNFRHARSDEAEKILALYTSVLGTPYCVWNEYYPASADIENDLAHDDLFVLTDRDDRDIVGAISIVPDDETGDLTCWTSNENAAEFARVVVRPDRQGSGLARVMVGCVENVLKQRGAAWIHILAAVSNIPACRTYIGCGYRIAGECDAYGHHYFAMEKKLGFS